MKQIENIELSYMDFFSSFSRFPEGYKLRNPVRKQRGVIAFMCPKIVKNGPREFSYIDLICFNIFSTRRSLKMGFCTPCSRTLLIMQRCSVAFVPLDFWSPRKRCQIEILIQMKAKFVTHQRVTYVVVPATIKSYVQCRQQRKTCAKKVAARENI